MWPSLETTPKTITVAGNCFHHPGHVPVIHIHIHIAIHFEGAGCGPVVITWIGRVHESYCCASPILLIEHCVTFRHDRRLLSYRSWDLDTTGQLVDCLQQKKENRFSLNRNGIMSFLGQQFYHSTLYLT